MLTTLFFIFLFICFGSIVIYSFLLGISPMPSSKKAKNMMIQLLPKNIEEGVIYELGSGWGGLALLLAKHYPNLKVIGFELSPIPYLFSRFSQLILRRTNLIIERKNFYDHHFFDAKAVLCYLYPGGMKKLAPKLKRELPEKSMIISNTFALQDWEGGNAIFFVDDWSASRIYRYNR
jgi:hypothetical protein